jgi:Uncharacterized conserved protein
MEYLQGRGVAFLVLPNPAAEYAEDTARKHGFPVEEVVKTVVINGRYGHALMVIPAGQELDLDLAEEALADPEARPANERDLARTFPDYQPGSLPPLGLFFLAPMYVDPSVAKREAVVFAAGRASLAIRMLTRDLFRDDPVVIAPLTKSSMGDETSEIVNEIVSIPEAEEERTVVDVPDTDGPAIA